MDAFSEGTGTFSVNDTDTWNMCQICIIQIFIQFRDGFVDGAAKQVDLNADRGRFGHLDLTGAGALHIRCGDHGFFL